jgi:hypothetical protein
MARVISSLPRIPPAQLRRLQALWHQWTRNLNLSREADRALRHYYVQVFSQGRARETKQLTPADAQSVIRWLGELVSRENGAQNRVAGVAGRKGYPQWRRVPPNAAAWRALWGCASALGMSRPRLNAFIRQHYGRLGLHGMQDLRTMADLNRVLWGLKAMLRRRGNRSPVTGYLPFREAA